MELRQIRYFVRVVELGSMSRAALELDMVQSALSQQISRLESELSTRLLQRTSKGTVPTEAENRYRLGNIYARRERYTEAVSLYKESLVREPAHSRAWHNLGITQLRLATATFIEMQGYTEATDPAGIRARHIVDSITRMLEESAAAEGAQVMPQPAEPELVPVPGEAPEE